MAWGEDGELWMVSSCVFLTFNLITANRQEHGLMNYGLPLFHQSHKSPPHGEKPAGSGRKLRGVLSSDFVRAEVTLRSVRSVRRGKHCLYALVSANSRIGEQGSGTSTGLGPGLSMQVLLSLVG